MNILSTVSLILGIILSICSIIALIRTKVQEKKRKKEEKQNDNEAIKEGMKALLRNSIEKIYYANIDNKTLREYERKNLDSLFTAYHVGLEGNTFACDMYNEMREWEVTR